ncbi:MAG TPA: bacteriohemerythrin [Noviherbaspirillum sp.]
MLSPTTESNFDASPLVWTQDLAIGNEMIDEDHQAIFEIANRLQAEIATRMSAEEQEEPQHSIVGEVLVELIEHTGGHFMREEALMQSISFPWYEEHKLQHKMLMNKVNSLHREFMRGRNDVSLEVAEFVLKWMIPHIMHADMELGRCIRASK